MIYKHPFGVSPSLSVTINGASVAYDSIKEVEVFLEANLHDMVILHLSGIPTRATADYRNRGVQVVLDTGANYHHEFNGYVVDIRPVSITHEGTVNGSPFQDAKIICMGTSYDMRGSKSKVWADYRLQDVVREMASTYGFSADVPDDPLVVTPLVQDGESDWQFLVRYARMLGYSVTLHATHLHVFDPFKAAERRISFNKLRSGKDVRATISPHPGNISVFTASLADNHPDGKYKDTVVTVHQDDGLVFDVALSELRGLTAPARFTDRLSQSVDNYEQAVRAIQMHSRDTYDFTATAEVLGVAGCKPGGMVSVEEYGSEVDGFWYVNSVVHRLNSAVFTSELGLLRNINSELVSSPPVTCFRAPPASRMVGGVWTTTKRIVNVYS